MTEWDVIARLANEDDTEWLEGISSMLLRKAIEIALMHKLPKQAEALMHESARRPMRYEIDRLKRELYFDCEDGCELDCDGGGGRINACRRCPDHTLRRAQHKAAAKPKRAAEILNEGIETYLRPVVVTTVGRE